MQESEKKVSWVDLLFVVIFVSLFLPPLLNLYGIRRQFLFEQTILGTSGFGTISGYLIFFHFLFWGCYGLRDRFRQMESPISVISEALQFVGLRRPSKTSILYAAFSMLLGAAFNLLILLLKAYFSKRTLVWTEPPLLQAILNNFIVPPLFEELVYRGIYKI